MWIKCIEGCGFNKKGEFQYRVYGCSDLGLREIVLENLEKGVSVYGRVPLSVASNKESPEVVCWVDFGNQKTFGVFMDKIEKLGIGVVELKTVR